MMIHFIVNDCAAIAVLIGSIGTMTNNKEGLRNYDDYLVVFFYISLIIPAYTSHCRESLDHSTHAGPLRIANFTPTIELLRSFV